MNSNRFSIVSVIGIKNNFYTVGVSKKRGLGTKSKVCKLDNQIKRS